MKLLAPILIAAFVLSACGRHEAGELADACKVQLSEDDCVMIGNNILTFTKGLEDYECAWKQTTCVMQLRK